MYPTLTKYAGPANANHRFQEEACVVFTLECTSEREGALGPDRMVRISEIVFFDLLLSLAPKHNNH
jgi:hypothetical protein